MKQRKTISHHKGSSTHLDYYYRTHEAEKLDAYGVAMAIDPVETPEEFILRQERVDAVRKLMLDLPARVERVLRLRWFEGLTLKEAGEDIGVTRERVRQLEAKGIRVLRYRLRHEFKAEVKCAIKTEQQAEREKLKAQRARDQAAYEARNAASEASEAAHQRQLEHEHNMRRRAAADEARREVDDWINNIEAKYYVQRDRYLVSVGTDNEQYEYREYIAAAQLRAEAERVYRRGG